MEQWEKYVSDQFFGRNFWRKIKVNADKISGTKKENGVFIGKSGQLLEDIAVPDKEQLEANINAVKNFAQTYENIPKMCIRDRLITCQPNGGTISLPT